MLELFHGPTAAFKDFGARFLAETLARLQGASEPPMTILVATSGDTAVRSRPRSHLRPWVRIVILYPKGQVSARQEQQLTCWGDNVIALRIEGTFDDCQRLVKEAFMDFTLRAKHRFSSANSINIGRLLPQMVYYAASSLEVERRTGAKPSYIIPAGNLGNAFAAVWRGPSGSRSSASSWRTMPTAPFRIPANRQLAPASEHSYIGFCHGRRQSK